MKHTLGLVSISFRSHSTDTVINATRDAGLDAIEWGGDIHVPHGEIALAAAIRAQCREQGLCIPHYGSYYRLGVSNPALFAQVAATADALDAPIIRVWGGNQNSDGLTHAAYERLIADARRLCDMAPTHTVALECHPGTVTDEYHTALRFLQDVDRPNCKMLWQPNQYRPLCYNTDAIRTLLPYLCGVHVFSWNRETRLPLAMGEHAWQSYLPLLKEKEGMAFLLEFMHDDSLASLRQTAAVLKSWF